MPPDIPIHPQTRPFAALEPGLEKRLPNFLIVSPPKTGTSWLLEALSRQSGFSTPPEKELRYFSTRHGVCDLAWYASRFEDVPFRGEATPTYAILPAWKIRELRRLLPDLKVIFLLREPVARTWSHARHCWTHAEAAFSGGRPEDIGNVTASQWREACLHPWVAVSGDYAGQIGRWRAAFPREQIFVGFFDAISSNPETLLDGVLTFLGAPPWTGEPPSPVNVGRPFPLPADLSVELGQLCKARTEALSHRLADEFGLSLPHSWNAGACVPRAFPEANGPPAGDHDDRELEKLICLESRPQRAQPLYESCAGFEMSLYRGHVVGIPHGTSDDLNDLSLDELRFLVGRGVIVLEDSLPQARRQASLLMSPQASPLVLQRLRALAEAGTPEEQLALRRWLSRVLRSPENQVLETAPGFNFVHRAGEYWGIPWDLGPVPLAEIEKQPERLLRAPTLDALRRMAKVAAASTSPGFEILGDVGGYNLLVIGDRFVAVAQHLGPLDPLDPPAARHSEWIERRHWIERASLSELRAAIDSV